ncbi:exopolysaccharide production protein ExoZ [Frankia sp. AiPs1]|uniref:acyltransferase family protein n=1 Tax=Frankia sp. AiPa1 TaxID=573492 RepID=UPI00202B5DE0|nr:acyltransferase [Frankia sp. AiPa1]MCL9760196.1 acyltransferase [Frankia sp. AiPa1]
MSHASPKSRLPSLTGIRSIAALLVFTFHAQWENRLIAGGSAGDDLSHTLDRVGNWGLGLFFLLSGFVLTWTARPDDSSRAFWRRRLAKVYPNHLTTFVLAVVILLTTAQSIPLGHWLPNLFLVQTWLPDNPRVISLNGVSWSLSAELLFYLSFPFLLAVVNRIRDERLWLGAGVVASLIIGAAFFSTYVLPDQPRLLAVGGGHYSYTQIWFVWFFPPVRALEFALGILLAKIVIAGRWVPIGLLPAAGLAFVGNVVSTYAVPYLFGVSGVATLWTVPLIAALAVADLEDRPSWMRQRILIWFGDRSFAFYMIHWLVLGRISHWVGPDDSRSVVDGLGLFVLAFAVSTLAAWLMFTYIEMPAVRRFGNGRSRGRARADERERPPVSIPAPSSPVESTVDT